MIGGYIVLAQARRAREDAARLEREEAAESLRLVRAEVQRRLEAARRMEDSQHHGPSTSGTFGVGWPD